MNKYHQLAETDFVCIMGNNNKFSNKALTLNDYVNASHGVVVLTEHGHEASPVDKRLKLLNKHRHITLTLSNFLSAAYFCEQTDIIFTMPRIIAVKLSEKHKIAIKPVPPELTLPTLKFRLYWHERYDLDPMCIWIRKILTSIPFI